MDETEKKSPVEATVKLNADQVERLWEITGERDPSRSLAILCERAIEELEQAKSPQVSRTVIEWDFRDFDDGNPFLDLADDESEKEEHGSKKSH